MSTSQDTVSRQRAVRLGIADAVAQADRVSLAPLPGSVSRRGLAGMMKVIAVMYAMAVFYFVDIDKGSLWGFLWSVPPALVLISLACVYADVALALDRGGHAGGRRFERLFLRCVLVVALLEAVLAPAVKPILPMSSPLGVARVVFAVLVAGTTALALRAVQDRAARPGRGLDGTVSLAASTGTSGDLS